MGTHESKPKKKLEFSKLIALFVLLVWLLVILCSLGLMLLTMDLSALPQLIISVTAQVTTVIGFYCWKARTENTIKLKSIYGKDVNIPPYNESTTF